MEWEEGTFCISKRSGTALVEGIKNDVFGIHRLDSVMVEEGNRGRITAGQGSIRQPLVKGDYALTHLPSGASILKSYPSQGDAQLAADLVLSAWEDLGVDPLSTEPHKGLTHKKRRQVGSASRCTARRYTTQIVTEDEDQE